MSAKINILPAAAVSAGCTYTPSRESYSDNASSGEYDRLANASFYNFAFITPSGWECLRVIFYYKHTSLINGVIQSEVHEQVICDNSGQSFSGKNYWVGHSSGVMCTQNPITPVCADITQTWTNRTTGDVYENTYEVESIDLWYENPSVIQIITESDPANGGVTSGDGWYEIGSSVTISATANPGYAFVRWSDDTTSPTKTFTATESTTYTAYFAETVEYSLTVVCDQDPRWLKNQKVVTTQTPSEKKVVAKGTRVTLAMGWTIPRPEPDSISYPYYAQLFSEIQHWENHPEFGNDSLIRFNIQESEDFIAHFDLLACEVDSAKIGNAPATITPVTEPSWGHVLYWQVKNPKGDVIATIYISGHRCEYDGMMYPFGEYHRVYYNTIRSRNGTIEVAIADEFKGRYGIEKIVDQKETTVTAQNEDSFTHTLIVDRLYLWTFHFKEHGILFDNDTNQILCDSSGILCR